MSTEQNKQLVLRWKEEIWNKRNVNIIDELYAPDYIGHIVGTPGPVRGREALKQLLAAYFAAFDIHMASEFLIRRATWWPFTILFGSSTPVRFRGSHRRGRKRS